MRIAPVKGNKVRLAFEVLNLYFDQEQEAISNSKNGIYQSEN